MTNPNDTDPVQIARAMADLLDSYGRGTRESGVSPHLRAPPAGLEPAAISLEGRCSIQLSYGGRAAHCDKAPAARRLRRGVPERTNLGERLRDPWCGWCSWSMRWEPTRRRSALSGAVLASALAVSAIPSAVGSPAPVAPDVAVSERTPAELNPLANRTWGVYKGRGDQAWTPTCGPRASKKSCSRRSRWGPRPSGTAPGSRTATSRPRSATTSPTRRRASPSACSRPRSSGWCRGSTRPATGCRPRRSSGYKDGSGRSRRGIGDAHVMLVLQPDGPFALCVPGGSDVPSSWWATPPDGSPRCPTPAPTSTPAPPTGCHDRRRRSRSWSGRHRHARGFALELHALRLDTRRRDRVTATAVVAGAGRGSAYTDKHFVVNTAANGAPFYGYDYDGPNFDNAATCKTKGHQAASRSASRRPPTSLTRAGG